MEDLLSLSDLTKRNMKSDIEIARSIRLRPIGEIAERLGIPQEELEPYGKNMAKVPLTLIDEEKVKKSKLILVTAITPTKAGIGKTTVSVGLALGLNKIGKNAVAALREPSLGPCFGMKGGAAGGGYAQILPMEKINLHFTGDFHAITSANNMISALLDNYLYQHQAEGFGLKQILWKRVMDVNDRSLRHIVTGLGPHSNGLVQESGFDITPASEIMAILCLSRDIDDLRRRIENILLGYTLDNKPFTVKDMGVAGAAWATILSQFLSAVLSLIVGLKNFPILHLRREDFHDLNDTISLHLKTGFPMGFQMSVMCIGQLAMQTVVNSLGTAAVAGYTAASKADQLSVLVNNAMMTAISNYVAQNFGAGKKDRIRQGVRASLIQTEGFNLLMCIGILLLRHPIVRMFLSDPTVEIYHYSDAYLTIVAPFYFILGLLAVYRTSIQSMQNGRAPFAACMIELVMRIAATVGLSGIIGYTSVCIASPLAWFGACALLIPVYYRMMKRPLASAS